ncbi:MAG: TraR/DksA C4-type zinc finger protein [Caldilineales bacterium]
MIRNDEPFRQQLEAERAELLETISHFEIAARNKKPGLGNHMADDGTEAFDQAAGLALHRNDEALLVEVDAALARLDKGTYGLCERCGNQIDYARLQALPYARLCISCQQYIEENTKGNGHRR